MNYVRQGYQEMAFNDDLDLEENIYVSKDGKLCTLYTQCAGEVFFNNIEIHKHPIYKYKFYIINDRDENLYEVLQDDIDELGVNAPATLIREVIEA